MAFTPRDRVNVYLDTIQRMERNITSVDSDAAQASIAISLKRIADVLNYAKSAAIGLGIGWVAASVILKVMG